MTFGITPTGFNPKTLRDVLTSLKTTQRATIDPNWAADDESLEGQLNAGFAAELAEVWEELDFVVNQYNPDDAEGVEQDMICSLSGTTRLKQTKGTVSINLTSSGPTTWPAGTLVAQDGDPTNVWVLDANVVAGIAGTFPGAFTAQNAGHIEAPAGTLIVRLSSVANWVGASNPLDAAAGRDVEKDPDLAIRREEELRGQGGASEPALSVDVEAVNPTAIKSVRTIENDELTPDVDGRPGKSFEVILWDPAPDGPVNNDLIAQAIWDSKALGIKAYGTNQTGNAKNTRGDTKVMGFTRVSEDVLHVSIDIKIDDTFPINGDDQVKEQLKLVTEKYLPGDTVYALDLRAASRAVQGVITSPGLRLKFGGAPSGGDTADLTVSIREIATLDTSNIVVNHV